MLTPRVWTIKKSCLSHWIQMRLIRIFQLMHIGSNDVLDRNITLLWLFGAWSVLMLIYYIYNYVDSSDCVLLETQMAVNLDFLSVGFKLNRNPHGPSLKLRCKLNNTPLSLCQTERVKHSPVSILELGNTCVISCATTTHSNPLWLSHTHNNSDLCAHRLRDSNTCIILSMHIHIGTFHLIQCKKRPTIC